jgi:sugar lactone lactonase YvrE
MKPSRSSPAAIAASLISTRAPAPRPATEMRHTAAAARLELIAAFEHQVTGVTVSPDRRIFVNFPRWTEDTALSVAELMATGELRPYPDAEWNTWRNARRDQITPHDHWVCVQSVVTDKRGNLWVIDAGAPAQAQVVPDAPKLVRIDLQTNRVAQTFAFDTDIAPQGSYLNDMRFSPDGLYAYITDSGTRGAIVVLDVSSGQARRLLDGDPTTQADKSVTVQIDGKPLRRPDGRGVEFSADGIALSPDGRHLYWQAVKGKTLYRIATAALHDAALSKKEVSAQVERMGENGPADGLHMDQQENLYVSAVQDHAIKVRAHGELSTLVQDPDLRWPDTFAEGPDGTIYITDSCIPDMNWFKPESPNALPTRLFKLVRNPV